MGSGADAPEGAHRLAQDLLAMRDEEYPAELVAGAVEGGEPGLAEARGHHDETCVVTGCAGLGQGFERFALNLVRVGRLGRRLAWDVDRKRDDCGATRAIALDPGGIDGAHALVREQLLEGGGDLSESDAVSRRHHAQVPLDALGERRGREVRASDVGDAAVSLALKDVRLRMEALPGGFEDAEIQAFLGHFS